MNSANNAVPTRQTNTSTASQVTENNNNSPFEPAELIQQRTVANEHSNGTAEADDGQLSTPTRRTVSTETAIDGAANRTTNNSAGGEDATFHNLRARFHHHGRLSRPLPTELFAHRSVRPTQLGSTPSEAECKANEPCSICRNGFTSTIKLRCGHIFCSQCIRLWFEHANTCPYCRTVVIDDQRR